MYKIFQITSSQLYLSIKINIFDKSNVYQLTDKKFIYDANLSNKNNYIFIYHLIFFKDMESFYKGNNFNDLKFFYYQSKIYNLCFQKTSDLLR